jgi:hypothetical protein
VAGSGYQVQVENLQDFAKKVRGLLAEFESGASGRTTHASSGFSSASLGPFQEARQLGNSYADMRDALRDMLDILYQAVDEAQRNADATARNYDEQERTTAAAMTYAADRAQGPAPAPSSTASPDAQGGPAW